MLLSRFTAAFLTVSLHEVMERWSNTVMVLVKFGTPTSDFMVRAWILSSRVQRLVFIASRFGATKLTTDVTRELKKSIERDGVFHRSFAARFFRTLILEAVRAMMSFI